MPLKKGDLVLVPMGDGAREVGTILALDQDFEDEDDGVLVKTKVSGDTQVYGIQEVEVWEMDKPTKENRGSLTPRTTRARLKKQDDQSSLHGKHAVSLSNKALSETDNEANTNEDNVSIIRRSSKGSRKGRTAATPAVTPSPITLETNLTDAESSSDEKQVSTTVDVCADTKAKATKKKSGVSKKQKDGVVDSEKPASKRKRGTTKSSSKTTKQGAETKACTSVAGAAANATKKKRRAKSTKKAVLIVHRDSDASDQNASVTENEDHVFKVEYSPNRRATCRRCDEFIERDDLRVSHVPLFNGKPGYRVYRHLKCAVFDEKIEKLEDIGGWRKLSREDRDKVTQRIKESRREAEAEADELQPDELVQETFSGEMRKPPKGLTASLLPYQVEGSSWMYCQEVNTPDIRGGILADEMGMGKTLQTIVTMLDNRPILQHATPGTKHPPSAPDLEAREREEELWATALQGWKHEVDMHKVHYKSKPKGRKGGARAGTLVVCPVIALSQWKSELEKFTDSDSGFSVAIYHGPKRASQMPPDMIRKYDVILTTYQVLEQDFRKMTSPNKVTCPNCGGKYKIDKLAVHLKYFCGEDAQRTEAQMRQRRARDQNNRGRQSRPPKKKQKTTKKVETRTHTPEPRRKTVKVKSSPYFDSDSELSIDDSPATELSGRPSRAAAVKASSKVKKTVVESKTQGDSSDASRYSEESDESASSEESEDVPLALLETKKRKLADTSNAAERAIRKQEQAFSDKSPTKGAKGGKKSKDSKKGTRKSPSGKTKSFDHSSDGSDAEKGGGADPMDGIDLEGLVAEAMAGARFSPLHSFCWWRVVLDEAHFIKSRSSQTSSAAFALTSIHRWCLSGTPLQNRVGELYSLIRFLRIQPMAYYYCKIKGCDCKSLHYRMKNGVCEDCGHRSFSHYAHFNRFVLNPIQRDGYSGDGRRAMFKLKNEVLDRCLLRRTKETKAADLELPPRIVTLRSIRLHPVEADFYNALYTQTKSSFDDYVAEGTLLNNYAHIFDLLTKMRQAVNHPYLIVYSKTNAAKRLVAGQADSSVANGSVICEICHEPPTERVVSSCCEAGFCRSCVLDYISGAGGGDRTPCPSCRAPFTIDLNQGTIQSSAADTGTLSLTSNIPDQPTLKDLSHVATGSILRRINLAEFSTSTKIEVLVQELIEMRQKRPGSKALVFSQFVNMLDLVRWRLHSDPYLNSLDLGVRIMHGGMDVKSRDAALRSFREDNQVRVLLMSLKSAGVALNLTAASEVFLLDLWWNPAAEFQALDRVHRIGQHRPIRAVRFVAEGTVEERVLQLQEKKRLVFDGTVGRDAGSLKMLGAEDMKVLFT